ncbi:MAG: iron-sulfur cluster assembly scaffold protein [Terriglobales bacterium]
MYSPQLLNHFQHPRNVGTLAHPDASARVENPACGDVLELSVKVSAGVIEEVRFSALGCVAAMACGSALTELVQGHSLAEASRLTREDLVRAVGGLPPSAGHASHLALDTLRAALSQII